ncbi:hypothetical protein MTR_7g104030 [Medicago truncatula]|uniref:Uncharacterized protein n=1 Tax=Medicago truncatula TaxID=3880 RepID=G7L5Y8_MEDTR|nr:hypothetical protein MTR_7g104030 [Medicago truncatula]
MCPSRECNLFQQITLINNEKSEGVVLNSTAVMMSDEMESVTAQDQKKRIFKWGPLITVRAQTRKQHSTMACVIFS